jgi:hypothetical protein
MIDEKEIDEAFSSFEKWEPVNDMGEHGIGHGKRAFKEGAHFGYAKAIEQASGGFEEWFNVYMPECDPKLAYNESRAAWTAAKLSSAKEIEELEEYKVMLNSQIDELEAKLDEAVEVLEKYASNEFITWLVATQQGMDCDPNKMARDTLTRLKSNGPITSEGK